MNASELRIGNLITQIKYANGNCYVTREVTAIRQEGSLNVRVIGAHNMKSHPAEWFIPIQLTEEWLLKFGFRKITLKRFDHDDMPDYLDCSISGGFITNGVPTHINYVHQLQNLFFCLTGKELSCG